MWCAFVRREHMSARRIFKPHHSNRKFVCGESQIKGENVTSNPNLPLNRPWIVLVLKRVFYSTNMTHTKRLPTYLPHKYQFSSPFDGKSFEINTFPAVITGDLTLVIYINQKLQTTLLHVKTFEIPQLILFSAERSDVCTRNQCCNGIFLFMQSICTNGNPLCFWNIFKEIVF